LHWRFEEATRMHGSFRRLVIAGLLCLSAARSAQGQISGSSLSHRSSGSGSGNWTLSENGYVGTYVTLAEPGPVTFDVSASGATSDATLPRMNLVVADAQVGFNVPAGFNSYEHTFHLPAGTYFVRTEFNNDVPTANRQLTVSNLAITGATVANTANTSENNALALAAADTYIANFRRGPAQVELVGAAPGTPVEVRMKRSAFHVGTMVQGFDANVFLAPVAPGDATSTAARYQQFVNEHFNILVPSNMGKWQPNENTPGVPTMGHVDTILNYAQSHDMDVRMHNLIWGNQQPGWVNNLITAAGSTNPTTAAQAKADLMTAITNRIAYYVGDGDADTSDGDRSRKYQEIDVINETLREGTYWDIFGAAGIAEIYKKVQDAALAAGSDARLYTNEYNIFQYANAPGGGAADNYANWYRRHIEEINNAGFGDVVTGVGIQVQTDARTNISQAHSPARMQQVLQNMSILGLPITLTEFSVHPVSGGVTTTEQRSAQIYNEALRMMYGSPLATSFLIWEAWPPATTDATTIFDSNWNLRASGQALVDLLDSWKTPDQNLTVSPDGTVDFTGYFGDYEVTVGGRTFDLELLKGTQSYRLVVAAPGDFDGDFDVDAEDLTVWQTSFAVDASADADHDGDTDGTDFLIWKRHLGANFAAAPASAVVPEPAAVLIAATALLAAAVRRRARPGRG
jgi:GH35 family endo-1,4-beta-xylanase